MFETLQNLINAGGYDLAGFTELIKTMYEMCELTEDEMKQLLEQAQDNAKPTIPTPHWLTVCRP